MSNNKDGEIDDGALNDIVGGAGAAPAKPKSDDWTSTPIHADHEVSTLMPHGTHEGPKGPAHEPIMTTPHGVHATHEEPKNPSFETNLNNLLHGIEGHLPHHVGEPVSGSHGPEKGHGPVVLDPGKMHGEPVGFEPHKGPGPGPGMPHPIGEPVGEPHGPKQGHGPFGFDPHKGPGEPVVSDPHKGSGLHPHPIGEPIGEPHGPKQGHGPVVSDPHAGPNQPAPKPVGWTNGPEHGFHPFPLDLHKTSGEPVTADPHKPAAEPTSDKRFSINP